MRTKLAIPVVLLLVFGRLHSLDFNIEKISETDLLNNQVYIGVVLSYGETNDRSFTTTNGVQRTKFGCLHNESRFRIGYHVPKDSQLQISLNVGSKDKPFENLESYYKDVEGDEKHDFCFLFGTWWPSETNESKKIEIYIDLVEPIRSIWFRDVFYLNSVSNNGVLKSSLYMTKERKKITVEDLDKSFAYKKKDEQEKELEPEEEEISDPALKEKYEIKKLIAKFEKNEQTVVGNMRCDVSKETQFDIVFGLKTVKPQGNGEFNMAFITNRIDKNEEEKAAKEFAEVGATKVVDTMWATLKCGDNGVDLVSKYKFPVQNEEEVKEKEDEEDEDEEDEEDEDEEDEDEEDEDEEENDDDEDEENDDDEEENDDENEQHSQTKYVTKEDKSEMLYSFTKTIMKNVEENKGKLKVTIEYQGRVDRGEEEEEEFEEDEDEFEEDERRRII